MVSTRAGGDWLPRGERLGAGAKLTRFVVLIVLAVLTGALVAALALPVVGGVGVFTRNMIGNVAFTDLPPELQQPPLSQRPDTPQHLWGEIENASVKSLEEKPAISQRLQFLP